MDFFTNMQNTAGPSLDTLFTFKDVSEKTQSHLKKVYMNLMACSGVCALGMYLNAFTVLSGFMWSVGIMLAMGYAMYKVMNVMEDENNRMGWLWALAFGMGYLVGPVMHQLAEFEPMILISAIGYTAIMFGSFSAVALFSKRRSYLFFGGIISTTLSCLFWYQTLSWMFGYRMGGEFGLIYLMTGLFVACMYVIYDTQMIIEDAERGNKDVPTHTMKLFMDMFDLFIKIVQILIKLNEDKDRKKRRDD